MTTQVDQNREDEDNSLPKLKRETETVPFTVGEVKPREIGSLEDEDGRINNAQSDVQPKDTKSITETWFPVPFPKHSTESEPYVVLSKNRVNNSSVIKGVMALMQYLDDGLYVEMEVNKARNSIKLIPVKKQTANSRNVLTDFGSHIQIGGGYVLTELGMPFGKYKMISKRPLILKWAGKPKVQEQGNDLVKENPDDK